MTKPRGYRHPFRFGAVYFDAPSREAWAAHARKVEDLGFTTLSVPDHFMNQLAPLTALMAAADATSALPIGSFVCANDFRNPAMLAKEVATLDFYRADGSSLALALAIFG